MFILASWGISNFRLIREFDSRDLGDLSGLTYVGGENEDVPAASANMAGKSTLFNALLWCLYGCDLAGESITDVITDGATRCRVTVRLEDPASKKLLRIARTRDTSKPNGRTTTLEVFRKGWNLPKEQRTAIGTPEELQEVIDALLGQRRLFLAAHVYGYSETNTPFALRGDAEQKQLFDLLVNAQDLDEAWKRAADRTALVAAEATKLRAEADILETRIAEHKKATQDISQLLVEGMEASKVEEESLKRKNTYFYVLLDRFRLASKQTIEYTNALLEELAELSEQRTDTVREVKRQLEQKTREKEEAQFQLEKYRDTKRCPLCGEITGKALEEQLERVLHDLLYVLPVLSEDLYSCQLTLRNMEEERDEAWKFMNEYSDVEEHLNRCLDILRRRLTAVEKQRKQQEDTWKRAQDRAKQIEYTQQSLEKVNDGIAKLDREERYLRWLKQAFGKSGIRAFRMDMITPRLNEIAKEYSDELYGDGTHIRYSTQYRLKNEELRDGFDVSIFDSGGSKKRACSAGEVTRRDIIHTLSIAKLADFLGKRTVSILVFDECFRTVDDAGIQAVLRILRELTQRVQFIAVIEHDNELKSGFDQVLLAKRAEGKTTVSWEK